MRKNIFIFILVVSFSAICFSQYKQRPAPVETGNVIKLSQPTKNGTVSLEQALDKRRSVRQFTAEPLTVNQIGQLCWAAQGITDPNKGLRTAPSAGALFPIQLYVALPEGLYLYQPASNALVKQMEGDLRRSLSNASFNQRVVQNAPCTFIITGSIKKIEAKYRNRGEKFTFLEAGHIAQNIQLQAVALGLGSVPIGTIDEKTIAQACKLPADLEVIYLIPVGNPTVKPVLAPSTAFSPSSQQVLRSEDIRTKRVVIIVPGRYFNDSEFYGVQQALLNQGIQPVIAGVFKGEIKGIESRGTQRNIITATSLIGDLKAEDYDAFVFISGPAAADYYNNRILLNLVRSANASNKILAAINTAPVIFAYADIIRGKNVTSFASERYRLVNAGANWKRTQLEVDGNLITAGNPQEVAELTIVGPGISDRFGTAIIGLLRRQQNY